jgi:predicted house-cleaning NTP pyrophosphatase (Maf/HAM1 superfamily)
MKSKKGFAEFFLIGSLIIVCLAINAISKPYNAEDRADIEKSFGQPKGNVISGIKLYSQMTDSEKAEFDKTSPTSASFW